MNEEIGLVLDEGLYDISDPELSQWADLDQINVGSAQIDNLQEPISSPPVEHPGIPQRLISHAGKQIHPANRA